jgi:choice-of-anchor B domain-containing protein
MRKIYILLFILFSINGLKAQQSLNMELLAQWNDTTLQTIDGDQLWSDIMGYHDSTKNKEYAILFGNDSFYFFDITNPKTTKLIVKVDGFSKKSINRDVEIYQHYAYCVSERSGSLGGLQILDLQYLPDSVHEVYRSDALTVQAHTVFIEAERKRMYIPQNSTKVGFSAMDIFSLNNPENPTKLASLQVPLNGLGEAQFSKVHEMYSRNDTVYLSCYENGLYMMDLTNLNAQKLLGVIANYPQRGTNHSSWLNAKGNMIMFTDENQGSPIKIFDISDIGNPKQIVYFNSHPNALPHNAYWKENMAVVSAYEDGVYIFDITNLNNPKVHAFYDTYPLNADGVYSGFHGCWGVWPYLPSGNIIASDISEGLFVMKPKYGVGEKEIISENAIVEIYPNPANKLVNFKIPNQNENYNLIIMDTKGLIVKESAINSTNLKLSIDGLNAGFYFFKISNANYSKTFKIIIE